MASELLTTLQASEHTSKVVIFCANDDEWHLKINLFSKSSSSTN